MYTEIASVIPSTTDSETYAWLGDIPGMRARCRQARRLLPGDSVAVRVQGDQGPLVDGGLSLYRQDEQITPAQKDWARSYALADPKGFGAFVEKAPQVVPIQLLHIHVLVSSFKII